MECPHCGEEAKIPSVALNNADQYGNSCVTVVECCGKAVRVTPIRKFQICPAYPADGEDDWGRKVAA